MSQRKLLLADDSITIQKVVNLTFADEGIEVITVGDGDSAMQKITEIAPDLVMADVNMPGLSGYEVCEKIRHSENLKSTPVILLVGSFEPFDEEKARTVGADDFLTKPFQSIRQLVSKVTDLLNNGTRENGLGNAPSVETTSSNAESELENADTLRNLSVPQPAADPVYGDAGMDDEMIETNHGDSYASSDSEYRRVTEPEFEAETQPLNPSELRELSFAKQSESDSSGTSIKGEYKSINEDRDESEQAFAQAQDEENNAAERSGVIENAATSSPTMFDFRDDDLLEIPFDEEDDEESEEEASEYIPTDAAIYPAETTTADDKSDAANYIGTNGAVQQTETEQHLSETQDAEEQASAVSAETLSQLSPEVIEAIVQKVVEKLSDKAVKDVAWEVVPEMADLIIKKMAEEKLKE